jgi:iron(III) transport system ATP-binding protein
MQKLQLKGLGFGYEDQLVIRNLHLKLGPEARLGIVGASGSGKSTLLKLIAGQLSPDTGSLFLDGINYQEERNERMDQHPRVALMAQDFDLDPNLTVDENMARHGRHLASSRLQRYLGKVHRAFSLRTVKQQRVHSLSGGQKQRLALACALISDADLLLLDEPFSQLDYALKHQILDFLESEVWDKTIIMVGHEPTDIMRFCQEVAVLNKGRILQKGRVEELYHYPKNEKVGRLTGLINVLKPEEQAATGIEESLFRPLHCRLHPDGDWRLSHLEYHAFGQLGVLQHPCGAKVKAQIPMEGAFSIGSTWQLSIKKP